MGDGKEQRRWQGEAARTLEGTSPPPPPHVEWHSIAFEGCTGQDALFLVFEKLIQVQNDLLPCQHERKLPSDKLVLCTQKHILQQQKRESAV